MLQGYITKISSAANIMSNMRDGSQHVQAHEVTEISVTVEGYVKSVADQPIYILTEEEYRTLLAPTIGRMIVE